MRAQTLFSTALSELRYDRVSRSTNAAASKHAGVIGRERASSSASMKKLVLSGHIDDADGYD
jgi:hypothetical protein